MADIHITREILRAVAEGKLPARVLIEQGLEHLTTLCPYCREEYLAFRKEQSGAYNYDAAFKMLPILLERHKDGMEESRKSAARDFRNLMRLQHQDRLLRIRRSHSRFRGTALAAMLLEESRTRLLEDAGQAYDLAEAAEAVLHHTHHGPGVMDLLARAAVYRGNANRRRDDYQAARLQFDFARQIVRNGGVTDPSVLAEIDSCEAVLVIDQRGFGKAEDLLSRSIALYTLAGEEERAAHPLLTLGTLYYHQGDCERAIEMTRAAAELMSPAVEPRLYISARYNLAFYLCEAGHYRAAADALVADRELFSQFPDSYTQLRLLWLEGKIAVGFEEPDKAERAFHDTREGFILQGCGYDAAMVSLDLALVYLRSGQAGEVVQLAQEMHRIFEAQDVHREAFAALLLFEKAAREEEVTVQLVEDLAAYLRRARSNPTLRFQKRTPT